MNGQQALWTMRRESRWPSSVWVVDGEDMKSRDWHQNPNPLTGEQFAELRIDEQDIPETLDFRCCVGLDVHVSGLRGESRARRLHNALIDAKARRVITSIHNDGSVDLLLHGVGNG